MNTYLVTYFITEEVDVMRLPIQQHFLVEAEDVDHAIEQMKDAYPDGNVVAVHLCVLQTPAFKG